jgi:hypothetical protein
MDSAFVDQLRDTIRRLKPTPNQPHSKTRPIFVHRDLKTCEHVFIRVDAVKKPLQAPYDGPYRVLKRDDKVFTLQLPNRQTNVSIDRLKPAYTITEEDVPTTTAATTNIPTSIATSVPTTTSTPITTTPSTTSQQDNIQINNKSQSQKQTTTDNLKQNGPLTTNNQIPTAQNQTRRGRTIRLPVRFT